MPTLHVCPVMFGRMWEQAEKADFYQTDPAILALGPTGIDWRVLHGETHVVADLETPEDQPNGICRLDP
jgi:hypothetical protein